MQGESKPFPNIVTADWSFLDENASRTKCVKCNKSRKYYCYSCCIALPHLQDKLPKVKLPLKVDIIKHPKELDGKSTAPHASILAPDDVTIHTYPCIPDYDREKVILVFPSKEAVSVRDLQKVGNGTETRKEIIVNSNVVKDQENLSETISSPSLIPNPENIENKITNILSSDSDNTNCSYNNIMQNNPSQQLPPSVIHHSQNSPSVDSEQTSQDEILLKDLKRKNIDDDSFEVDNSVKQIKTRLHHCPFEKVLFIDCTWNQTKQIIGDERLNGLKKVELKTEETNFWRTQEGMPKTYLSTIEAIYFFFKEFHSAFLDTVYSHDYDNLLLFFCFMYTKIKQNENERS